MSDISTVKGVSDAIQALVSISDGDSHFTWFAATASGLLRSRDGGAAWSDAYTALDLTAPLSTASLSISTTHNGMPMIFAGALGGILRSSDMGNTWSVATLPSPPPYVVSLAASPNFEEDGLVFAATLEDGVFRSWDRGVSWASWNFGLLDLNAYCLAASPDFANDDTLFAGTESGVFYSANGGRAWRETSFPMDDAPVLSLAVSADFRVNRTLVAGTESSGIFRSQDGGKTWTKTDFAHEAGAVNHLFALGADDQKGKFIAVTGDAIYALSDGLEWRRKTPAESLGGVQYSAACLEAGEHCSLLIGTEDGRVFKRMLTDGYAE